MKNVLMVLFFLCSITFNVHSASIDAERYEELKTPVPQAPDVVEFFSFYCPPCRQFAQNYPVTEHINQHLGGKKKVIKYHVSALGDLGSQLSEAWAIAIAMGVDEQVEIPLFAAVQTARNVNNINDIKEIFSQYGVSSQEYDNARHSTIVKSIVERQSAMVKAFRVTSTPSYYVKGRFMINNSKIKADSPQSYADEFAETVMKLMRSDGYGD